MTRPETAALSLPRREPAAILGLVQAALVVTAIWLPISTELQAAILAATGATLGLITTCAVTPTRPAAILAVVQTGLPLLVLLGAHLPDGAAAAILGVAAAALGLLTRAQVSPTAARPLPPAGPTG